MNLRQSYDTAYDKPYDKSKDPLQNRPQMDSVTNTATGLRLNTAPAPRNGVAALLRPSEELLRRVN